MSRMRCRTCDDRDLQRFGFCASCWAAAKFGFGWGSLFAIGAGALAGIVSQWF